MLSEVLMPILAMEPESKGKYHARPSSAGRCERALVYHYLGVQPEDFSERTLHLFRDGHWHEELTADLIRKTAFKLHSEQMSITIPAPGLNPDGYKCSMCGEIAAPDTMHGHIDGILQSVDGVERLYEHKSLSRYQFDRYNKILESGQVPPADDYYMAQLHLYMSSDEIRLTGIDKAIFFVKSKDTSQMLDFEIQFDESIANAAIEKLQRVEAMGKNSELPPRPYVRSSWQCSYCLWEKVCYANYDEEVHGRTSGVVIDDKGILSAITEARKASGERLRWEKMEDAAKNKVKLWMIEHKYAEAKTPEGAPITLKASSKKGFVVAAKPLVETFRIGNVPKPKKKKGA